MTRVVTMLSLVWFVAAPACGGQAVGSGSGSGTPDSGQGGHDGSSARVPQNHRPSDSACMTTPPVGSCSPGGPAAMCDEDSDCEDGVNGRCDNEAPAPIAGCSCSYDTCAADSSCPTGQTCACHDTPYVYGGNHCVTGDCRVDADCGVGGYCSPSIGLSSCGDIGGYYCHTPSDACVDDSDCSSFEVCAYDTGAKHWACAMNPACA
jgi:hypothetical protein